MFKNSIKTAVLLAGFGVLFMVIGSFFGTGGLIIGLGIGLAFVGGSYWFSDTLAVKAAGAKPVTEQEAPQLYGIVRDLTQRAEMPMPKIYISPAQQPNAFATGRNPDHAAVAVTQGLLQVVSEDELRGVLAHEISHVRHRDILIASVAAAMAMAIMFIARMAMFSAIFGGGGGGNDRDSGNAMGALMMMLLAPLAAAAAAGGALPFAGVRGGPWWCRAARQRRAPRKRAREDRCLRQAGADEHRPRPRVALHRQPALGPEDAVRELVHDAPAHRGSRRSVALLRAQRVGTRPSTSYCSEPATQFPTRRAPARQRSCAPAASTCCSTPAGRSSCGSRRPPRFRGCSTRCSSLTCTATTSTI